MYSTLYNRCKDKEENSFTKDLWTPSPSCTSKEDFEAFTVVQELPWLVMDLDQLRTSLIWPSLYSQLALWIRLADC